MFAFRDVEHGNYEFYGFESFSIRIEKSEFCRIFRFEIILD